MAFQRQAHVNRKSGAAEPPAAVPQDRHHERAQGRVGNPGGGHGVPQAGELGLSHQLLASGSLLHAGRGGPLRRAWVVVVPFGVVLPVRHPGGHRGGLVAASERGFAAGELESVLHVDPRAALLDLVRAERVGRQQVGGRYVYLSADPSAHRHRLAVRQVYDAAPDVLGLGAGVRVLPEEIKAAIVLLYSLLDERQRRLYARAGGAQDRPRRRRPDRRAVGHRCRHRGPRPP